MMIRFYVFSATGVDRGLDAEPFCVPYTHREQHQRQKNAAVYHRLADVGFDQPVVVDWSATALLLARCRGSEKEK
jgi:hypothetical protein